MEFNITIFQLRKYPVFYCEIARKKKNCNLICKFSYESFEILNSLRSLYSSAIRV